MVEEELELRSRSSSSSSRRRRWRRPRSARCTAPCSRTGAVSRSRCSGPRRRARSRPTSRSSTRRRGSSKERVRALDFIDARELVDEFARSIRQELDYRLEARNAADVPPQLRRRTRTCASRASTGATPRQRVLTLEFLDGQAGRRPRARAALARRAPRSRVPDDRGVDDDDLPARLLPRRPAPGEHPRARARARSASSTSAKSGKLTDDDMSKLTRALHRRGDRERRRAAAAARRPRRPLRPKAREEEFRSRLRELYYTLLRRAPLRDRPAAGDPRGVRADLLA